MQRGTPHRITRRSLFVSGVGIAGLLGAGALVSACSPSPPSATSAPPSPAPAAAPTAPAAAASGATQSSAKPTTAAASGAVPAASAQGSSGQSVQIRLHVRTGTEADTLAELIPPFEKANNVTVKIETFPTAEYFQKLETLLAGGQAGDVWWTVAYTGQAQYQAARNILLSLDDLVKAEKFDLSQYFQPCIDAVTFQGKLIGLPYKLHPGEVGIYYNANAFKAAGVDEPQPKTHDELVQIADKMTKRNGSKVTQYGFIPVYATTPHLYFYFARAWGTDLLTSDGTKATVNDPKAIQAWKYVWDLAFTHKVAPTLAQVTGQNVEQMYINGLVAMEQGASSSKSLPTRVKDKFTVKDVLMPRGPSGKLGTWMVTDVIVENAKTAHKDQAWQLVKLMCGQEFGIRLGEGTGGASGTCGGRKDVFESDRLKTNPLHQIWIDAVELQEPGNQMVVPANFRGDELWATLGQKMAPLWLGDAQPTQAFFDDVNKSLQGVLDKKAP